MSNSIFLLPLIKFQRNFLSSSDSYPIGIYFWFEIFGPTRNVVSLGMKWPSFSVSWLIILHPWNSWIIWKLCTLRCCRNRFLYPVVDCFIYTYVTGPRVCCSSYWCDSSIDYLFVLSMEPCLRASGSLRPALGPPDRDKSLLISAKYRTMVSSW